MLPGKRIDASPLAIINVFGPPMAGKGLMHVRKYIESTSATPAAVQQIRGIQSTYIKLMAPT
jgi:hypothetical protein